MVGLRPTGASGIGRSLRKCAFVGLTFSSPLGPRIEISPQFRQENTRMDVLRLFYFHKNRENREHENILCEKLPQEAAPPPHSRLL